MHPLSTRPKYRSIASWNSGRRAELVPQGFLSVASQLELLVVELNWSPGVLVGRLPAGAPGDGGPPGKQAHASLGWSRELFPPGGSCPASREPCWGQSGGRFIGSAGCESSPTAKAVEKPDPTESRAGKADPRPPVEAPSHYDDDEGHQEEPRPDRDTADAVDIERLGRRRSGHEPRLSSARSGRRGSSWPNTLPTVRGSPWHYGAPCRRGEDHDDGRDR